MAILKKIELNNGIITNYHRVVSINNITNHSSIIEVASYTNEDKRLEEKEAIENGTPMNVFIETNYLSTDYNKNLNVDNAYDYLKTTEMFEDAKDV